MTVAADLRVNRVSGVVVYEVRLTSSSMGSDWAAGPVALMIDEDEVTDARWRCQFVNSRVQRPLYAQERRHHRVLDSPGESCLEIPSGSREGRARHVEATHAELLRFRSTGRSRTNALLALHLSPESTGRALVADLKYLSRDLDRSGADGLVAYLQGITPVGCCVQRSVRHATLLVFVTHAHDTELGVAPSAWSVGAPAAWSEIDSWRWALAMASPPTRKDLERPQEPDPPGRLLRMPRRDVQVVDRGVAFMATQHDTRAAARSQFTKDETRVRSMYLDALMLGVVQRVLLAQLADDVASCGDPDRNQRALRAVQRDVRIFRNRYWWREFCNWGWPDEVLRAYQEIHSLPEGTSELASDLSDFAAEVEAANGHRLNLSLGIIAVLGIPGVAATILPSVGATPTQAACWLVGIGIACAIPALFILWSLARSFTSSERHDHLEP